MNKPLQKERDKALRLIKSWDLGVKNNSERTIHAKTK